MSSMPRPLPSKTGLLWILPTLAALPMPPRSRWYADSDFFTILLRLTDLYQTVLPTAAFPHTTPIPTTWSDAAALIHTFHKDVNHTLFPNEPHQMMWFTQDWDERLALSLDYIAPVSRGVPCYHCDPPPPGDLVHMIQLLECLSHPYTPDAQIAYQTWETVYPHWYVPATFNLELSCLQMEAHSLAEPYSALPLLIRYALGCTGNWFLDACPHCWFEEVEPWYWPDFPSCGIEDVHTLTTKWREAQPLWDAICEFNHWFTELPRDRALQTFAKIIAAFHMSQPTPAVTLPLPF